MKKTLIIILIAIAWGAKAQVTGSITVGGDFDKFYPTIWADNGWNNHIASQLQIGRSDVHENSSWRGSLIASFAFHTFSWGHGARFIDANIIQSANSYMQSNINFIAGWQDVSYNNSSNSIVIWLKGGGTTYHYNSTYATTCTVYDGIINPLPFQEINGPSHTYKMTVDPYVNSNGLSKGGTAYFTGNSTNYFEGNIGIGTRDTKGYKLAVAGNVIAESVKVQLRNGWPDYVFEQDYKLQSLAEIEQFVRKNKHLPEIPSEETVKAEGIELGEMNMKLLKKIEELTLHLIEQEKKNQSQLETIMEIKKRLVNLESK